LASFMASNGCMTPSWPPSSSITRISRARIRSLTRIRSLCRKLRSAISPPQALCIRGHEAADKNLLPRHIQGLAPTQEPIHHREAMNPTHTVEKRLGTGFKV
jgi:hypothetical protein